MKNKFILKFNLNEFVDVLNKFEFFLLKVLFIMNEISIKTEKNKFSFEYFSDIDFEFIALEVLYNNQRLYELNKEKGDSNIEIDFFKFSKILEEKVILKFNLNEFVNILDESKCILLEA